MKHRQGAAVDRELTGLEMIGSTNEPVLATNAHGVHRAGTVLDPGGRVTNAPQGERS